MEFTGLKDKNGREIYEGDIVRGIMPDTEQDESFEKMIIEYQGDSFVVARPNHLYFGSLESCVCNNCIEVIGNIFENKELLDL
jgi:uncharacterized phage protein (TIGR01671 family)